MKLKPYPTWVCTGCVSKTKEYIEETISTFHEGRCDVCNTMQSVTEPRDFGYPKFKGHKQ